MMPGKRIKGGTRVLRGQIAAGTYNGSENRIQLFDGKYTTGYRIVEFKVMDSSPTANYEIFAKMSTEPKSTVSAANFSDVQELAYAGWAITNSANGFEGELIIQDNMAIEDMWISAYSSSENRSCNYYLVLEKYEFPAWDGAGILVENLSQAGPQ